MSSLQEWAYNLSRNRKVLLISGPALLVPFIRMQADLTGMAGAFMFVVSVLLVYFYARVMYDAGRDVCDQQVRLNKQIILDKTAELRRLERQLQQMEELTE